MNGFLEGQYDHAADEFITLGSCLSNWDTTWMSGPLKASACEKFGSVCARCWAMDQVRYGKVHSGDRKKPKPAYGFEGLCRSGRECECRVFMSFACMCVV